MSAKHTECDAADTGPGQSPASEKLQELKQDREASKCPPPGSGRLPPTFPTRKRPHEPTPWTRADEALN